MPDVATVPGLKAWRPSLVSAGLGLAAMAALFMPEIRGAVHVWVQSTAFGHCFLVLPIAIWLAWERLGTLALLQPRPAPALALLVLPCTAAWLLAERLGLMEGRELTALAIVWVLVLGAFGPGITWAMAAPLAYLVFLVPFGAFLVPALQNFTAHFIEIGLTILAIPHAVDQVLIEIPEGQFLVAEACAGLRFLIAAVAFGTCYALLIYRSTGRRVLFITAAIVIPIVCNGLRALGIVVLGHILGSAQAGAVDHVLYGWLFFSVVILLLILVGLPFREDKMPFQPRAAPPAPRLKRSGGVAVACVLALGCLGPLAARALDSRSGRVSAAPVLVADVAPPPGCRALPPRGPVEWHFACDGGPALLRIQRFDPRVGAGRIQAQFLAADGLVEGEDVQHAPLSLAGGVWRLSSSDLPAAAAAAAVWLGGRPSPGGLRDRLQLAWASIAGGGPAPVMTTAFATGPGAERTVRDLALKAGMALSSPPPGHD